MPGLIWITIDINIGLNSDVPTLHKHILLDKHI